ncbi:MAG TPA: hypothetical protein VFX61_18015 [Micromonosporaceae bacterium]|nr:hypothetical protein [Micromonosporaceae bacterium]
MLITFDRMGRPWLEGETMFDSYLFGYLPSLLLFVLGVWGYSTRFILRRRGVRVEGKRVGENWTAGSRSWVFLYEDQAGESHTVVVSPEDAPIRDGKIDVVFDPRKPDTAMSEFELRRPVWKTMEMLFFSLAAVWSVWCTLEICADRFWRSRPTNWIIDSHLHDGSGLPY